MGPIFLTFFIAVVIGTTAGRSLQEPVGVINYSTASRLSRGADDNFTTCQSESCNATSRLILEGLRRDVSPCDDFYEFACGNWIVNNPMPANKERWSRMSSVEERIENSVIEILDSPEVDNDTRPVKLMKECYKQCVDLDGRNQMGLKPLVDAIGDLGGWPLLQQNAADNVTDWQSLDMKYANITGLYSLFNVSVETDEYQLSFHKIKISPPEHPRTELFPLSTRWNSWSPRMKKITIAFPYGFTVKKIAEAMLKHGNVSYSEDTLDADILAMIEFEYKLYTAELNASRMNGGEDTISRLQTYYDDYRPTENLQTGTVNWLVVVRNIFQPLGFLIAEQESISVPLRGYLSGLRAVLESTPNRVIVNYVHWNFIAKMSMYTTEEIRQLLLLQQKVRPSLSSQCASTCRLDQALYYEYAKRHFPVEKKNAVLNIAESTISTIISTLSETSWLADSVKSKSRDKLQHVRLLIGYPDWYNDDNITAFYEDLPSGSNYFDKMIHLHRFSMLMVFRELHTPIKKDRWQLSPFRANARYADKYYNSITFPMAFIDSLKFAPDLPASIQYGLIGFTVAHESFHSVLPYYAIQNDKDGGEFIWPKSTMDSYNERLACLAHQFGNQSFSEEDPLTGERVELHWTRSATADEDVADAAGIRVNFATYQRHKEPTADWRLLGLEEYNSDQLFFLTFTTRWCHTARSKWWRETYNVHSTDVHAPLRSRVMSALGNFEEFSRTFGCPTATPMNHSQKCKTFGK